MTRLQKTILLVLAIIALLIGHSIMTCVVIYWHNFGKKFSVPCFDVTVIDDVVLGPRNNKGVDIIHAF